MDNILRNALDSNRYLGVGPSNNGQNKQQLWCYSCGNFPIFASSALLKKIRPLGDLIELSATLSNQTSVSYISFVGMAEVSFFYGVSFGVWVETSAPAGVSAEGIRQHSCLENSREVIFPQASPVARFACFPFSIITAPVNLCRACSVPPPPRTRC